MDNFENKGKAIVPLINIFGLICLIASFVLSYKTHYYWFIGVGVGVLISCMWIGTILDFFISSQKEILRNQAIIIEKLNNKEQIKEEE